MKKKKYEKLLNKNDDDNNNSQVANCFFFCSFKIFSVRFKNYLDGDLIVYIKKKKSYIFRKILKFRWPFIKIKKYELLT